MAKKIIVTGADGNLGKAVVGHFADRGYLIEAATGPGASAGDIEKSGVSASSINLLDKAETVRFVNNAFQGGNEIEGAVLTVGGFSMGGLMDTSAEDIQKMIKLNFETALNIAKPLIAKFEEAGNGGKLVFIGTRPAFKAEEGKAMIGYSLSKSLLFRLSEMINAEYADKYIRSYVITPGTMDTPQNRESMPGADFSKWVPLERVAEAIGFIFTEAGSMLNDTVIKIYNRS